MAECPQCRVLERIIKELRSQLRDLHNRLLAIYEPKAAADVARHEENMEGSMRNRPSTSLAVPQGPKPFRIQPPAHGEITRDTE